MARKKGDVMFETTPFLTFYHILTGDPSVSGFAHTIGITLGKDGSLSMVNANACINVNQPRAGVVTTWLEPEVIDREFKEVEPAAPVQELDSTGNRPLEDFEIPAADGSFPGAPRPGVVTGDSKCNCWCQGDPFKAPEQHTPSCPESLESRRKEQAETAQRAADEGIPF
jgi:hypothetical protein